ncbi:hypothetical protein GPECTOR_181g260 [Gonium pectorale]|uniref:Protein kinase domain-containing protein n=1 Tax=Gonium pectorale TaxID=33097 RepID=A0A150FX64_GONPE|nr:hypothetical protein GPECTOR_181g260 [Gonium pectorale]|eukprot:KXZ42214.1 hypothetical protein GPECTOR_181g260 [Gonium pectorale]
MRTPDNQGQQHSVGPFPASIAPNELELTSTVLWVGGTGRVVLGYYRGQEVAVKLLPLSGRPAGRQALEREVQLLARASAACRHVVQLLGVSRLTHNGGGGRGGGAAVEELALVMRRYPQSLKQYLDEQPGETTVVSGLGGWVGREPETCTGL